MVSRVYINKKFILEKDRSHWPIGPLADPGVIRGWKFIYYSWTQKRSSGIVVLGAKNVQVFSLGESKCERIEERNPSMAEDY